MMKCEREALTFKKYNIFDRWVVLDIRDYNYLLQAEYALKHEMGKNVEHDLSCRHDAFERTYNNMVREYGRILDNRDKQIKEQRDIITKLYKDIDDLQRKKVR